MENQIVWESRQDDLRRLKPNALEKMYVLLLHKIHVVSFPEEDLEEKLIRWVRKEFKTFNEEARLSIQHWANSWHKRMYKINHRKVKDHPEELFSNHRIIEVVRVTTKQQHMLDYMDQIIMIRENDKLDSFFEGDFKYLNKNGIEDIHHFGRLRECLSNLLGDYNFPWALREALQNPKARGVVRCGPLTTFLSSSSGVAVTDVMSIGDGRSIISSANKRASAEALRSCPCVVLGALFDSSEALSSSEAQGSVLDRLRYVLADSLAVALVDFMPMDTPNLEDGLDVEEQLLDVDVETGFAILLFDKEIALDEVASEPRSSEAEEDLTLE
ncbi:hypothetical protein Tco_0640596 [Tanacetum coccineum]